MPTTRDRYVNPASTDVDGGIRSSFYAGFDELVAVGGSKPYYLSRRRRR